MLRKGKSKIKIALAIPFAIVAIFFFTNSAVNVKASEKIKNDKNTFIQDTLKKEVVEEGETYYFEVDKMPKFQGKGKDAFRVFIQQNLKYPKEAIKNGVSGRVFVQFDINENGELINAKVVRGTDPDLDKEALRVVNLSPNWSPGIKDKKSVNVRFTFPITFSLN